MDERSSGATSSRLTRFRVDPERSWVVVEGESSVHPIQRRATGVEGTIEIAFARDRPELTTAPRAHVELGTDRIGSGNRLQDAEMRRAGDALRTRRSSATSTVSKRPATAEWHQVIDIREFDVNPPRILMLRVHPEVRVTVYMEAESESNTARRSVV